MFLQKRINDDLHRAAVQLLSGGGGGDGDEDDGDGDVPQFLPRVNHFSATFWGFTLRQLNSSFFLPASTTSHPPTLTSSEWGNNQSTLLKTCSKWTNTNYTSKYVWQICYMLVVYDFVAHILTDQVYWGFKKARGKILASRETKTCRRFSPLHHQFRATMSPACDFYIRIHTYTSSLSHTQTQTHFLSHLQARTHTNTSKCTHTHTLTLTHTHTLSHTHTHDFTTLVQSPVVCDLSFFQISVHHSVMLCFMQKKTF